MTYKKETESEMEPMDIIGRTQNMTWKKPDFQTTRAKFFCEAHGKCGHSTEFCRILKELKKKVRQKQGGQ